MYRNPVRHISVAERMCVEAVHGETQAGCTIFLSAHQYISVALDDWN